MSTDTKFSTKGLSKGLLKVHRWTQTLQSDGEGYVLVYGPATANSSPWGDKLLTVDQTILIVKYNPTTGEFDVSVLGRKVRDYTKTELPDGRTVESMSYPYHWSDTYSIHELPEGAKSFLMNVMSRERNHGQRRHHG